MEVGDRAASRLLLLDWPQPQAQAATPYPGEACAHGRWGVKFPQTQRGESQIPLWQGCPRCSQGPAAASPRGAALSPSNVRPRSQVLRRVPGSSGRGVGDSGRSVGASGPQAQRKMMSPANTGWGVHLTWAAAPHPSRLETSWPHTPVQSPHLW